jgi:hypothetical protein
MKPEMTHTDIASEPITARPMTSYADVMAYIHGINISREDKMSVGRQLLYEAKNENQAKVLIRLDHLATLGFDWDGYGAAPVSTKALNNLREVLSVSRDTDWAYWMISPESNGALCLQSVQQMSSISVGTDEFSYYSCIAGKEKGEDHIPFTPKKFLGIMRKIV